MALLIQPPQWSSFDTDWRKSNPNPAPTAWTGTGPTNQYGVATGGTVGGMNYDQWTKAWADYRAAEDAAFKAKYGSNPSFSVVGPPVKPINSTPSPTTPPTTSAATPTTPQSPNQPSSNLMNFGQTLPPVSAPSLTGNTTNQFGYNPVKMAPMSSNWAAPKSLNWWQQ